MSNATAPQQLLSVIITKLHKHSKLTEAETDRLIKSSYFCHPISKATQERLKLNDSKLDSHRCLKRVRCKSYHTDSKSRLSDTKPTPSPANQVKKATTLARQQKVKNAATPDILFALMLDSFGAPLAPESLNVSWKVISHGTSLPPKVPIVNGLYTIDKNLFNKILSSDLSTIKTTLRKKGIHTTRLPAAVVSHRIHCLQNAIANHYKLARKTPSAPRSPVAPSAATQAPAKKQKKKTTPPPQKDTPSVTFVPEATPSPAQLLGRSPSTGQVSDDLVDNRRSKITVMKYVRACISALDFAPVMPILAKFPTLGYFDSQSKASITLKIEDGSINIYTGASRTSFFRLNGYAPSEQTDLWPHVIGILSAQIQVLEMQHSFGLTEALRSVSFD